MIPHRLFWKKEIRETRLIESHITVDEEEISSIEPYLTDELEISQDKSIIRLKNNYEYVVNHGYNELINRNKVTIRGFYGNKDLAGN